MESPVALIADTHNLVRGELIEAMARAGVKRILHCGDFCNDAAYRKLCNFAPVEAVRGNNDTRGAVADLPLTRAVDLFGKAAYLVHIRADLDLDPASSGVDYVFYGHTHRPADELVGGVRFFNPGSAGPRRFSLPVTFALVHPDRSLELVALPTPAPR